ncbi:hypothetical protein QDA04_gp78 [Microbacterium phage Megan]|uniref:Uncharacterized protein n=1 Tax=Microbacterium phage Megan TaxID=2656551 RepID=A0A649VK99_9CAUD|nr:hypothetical protein QDA04_gp78 [Microbacterium phage Megan]QGJ92748.1 hypothetical protein PBI_MEGAN_78 [Microbacterium phage Megan]
MARPTRSPLGAPLLERLARRYASAQRAARSDDWRERARVENRMGHIMREAERADITYDHITAEAQRLGLI